MFRASPSLLFRYSLALSTMALALLATCLLRPFSQPPVYYPSFLAVVTASWFGGMWPGVFVTVLAGLAIDYFYIGAPFTFEFDLAHFENVGMFMVMAVVTGYFAAARRSMEESLRAARDDLDIRVQERTRDLYQANMALEERNKELWRLQGEMSSAERFATLGRITGAIAHDLGTPLKFRAWLRAASGE